MESTNLTLPNLTKYIEALAKAKAQGKPYTIDFHDALVQVKDGGDYRIRIPERILNSIELEEL